MFSLLALPASSAPPSFRISSRRGTRCSASPVRTQGAAALAAAGAEVHRGDLEDLDSLRSGAASSDGVIHLGFIHDFSRFQEVCEADRRAIEAIGDALAGSDRPLVITSGTGMGTPGARPTRDRGPFRSPTTRTPARLGIAAEAVAARGVRVSVVRLPQVHNTEKQGLVTSRDRRRPREGRRGLRRRRAQSLARGACARRCARLQAGPREGI